MKKRILTAAFGTATFLSALYYIAWKNGALDLEVSLSLTGIALGGCAIIAGNELRMSAKNRNKK